MNGQLRRKREGERKRRQKDKQDGGESVDMRNSSFLVK